MSNGFRQAPAGSKKEMMKAFNAELRNLNMATRISQMMMKKLATDIERLDRDIANAIGMINDLQYRTLATIEVGNLDKDKLNDRADEMKLDAFNAASTKDDLDKNLSTVDEVDNDSIVTVTSEAENDKGIFRSKFKLSDSGLPELNSLLLGKKVGDKVTTKINEVDHTVEVLAIKKEPVPAPTSDVTQVTTDVQPDLTANA